MSKQDLATRFWAKVNKTDGCWYWTAAKDTKGYGVIQIDGKTHKAHRIAYELTYGVVLGSAFGCHSCDTPGCVRPDHIFPATNQENTADRNRKGRTAKGSRVPVERRPWGTRNGHSTKPERTPRGEQSGRAILTAEQVQEIKARYIPRVVTHAQLAQEYGVSEHTIRHITRGDTWKHLDDGRYITSAATYSQAEAKRMEYLASLRGAR